MKKWRKVKGQVQTDHLTAWTLRYHMYHLTGCNHLHLRSCGNDHSRKGIMLQSWAYFSFSAYLFHPLSHSFPTYSLTYQSHLYPVTSQVTSQVTWPFHTLLSCALATVLLFAHYRVPAHPLLLFTHYGLPAYHQLMMELYLDCQLTASLWCDLTICDSIVLWPLLFVTSYMYISAYTLMVRP